MHSDILTEVWREVSRHVQIQEAVEALAGLLDPFLPPHRMAVYRYEEQGRALEKAAMTGGASQLNPLPERIPLEPDEVERYKGWAREKRVLTAGAQAFGDNEIYVSTGTAESVQGRVWAPLITEDTLLGVVFLNPAADESYRDKHVALLARLLDPLAVALGNDRRLHELERLRNVAEADRVAALRRLGRDQLTNEVIGAHNGLRFVMERLDMVARTDVPVLLLGETGTGKEMIARLIHEKSTRRDGPFLRVNSGAIPPDLLDAELFGHEKGAFTGAVASRRGWFERADGGTLLLDEVGELTPAAQVRLLRVLQEHCFERVGGEKTVHVNVRVVAATHRDLPSMVRQGVFRQDLWYRLSGFPLLLPALRERKQDIPDLARHFAKRAARIFSLKPLEPKAEDLALLCAYDWPGNIRELAAVIDRSAILGNGNCLDIPHALGTGLAVSDAPVHAAPAAAVATRTTGNAGIDTLNVAMRKHIEVALAAAGGQVEGKQGTATLLDINPHTLRARMRKLGIDPKAFRH